MDQWLKQNLVCPRDHLTLSECGQFLTCPKDHVYRILQGVPIMLLDEIRHTHEAASETLKEVGPTNIEDPFFISTLGCSNEERRKIRELLAVSEHASVDPVVQFMIGATSGFLYRGLQGALKEYPIPTLRMQNGNGKVFVDIGCNWGRWCISAARKGYTAVGIDPSLGAVLAARRVSKKLGLDIAYVVGDARHLPFRSDSIDAAFSYSVLQHFSKQDAIAALSEAGRVLKHQGVALIQMAHAFGIRSLQHQLRRRFRKPIAFEVRYWTIGELHRVFTRTIGPTSVSVDGFFGLGIQVSDLAMMPRKHQFVIRASELLRRASCRFSPMAIVADSLYLRSTPSKQNAGYQAARAAKNAHATGF